MNKVLYCYRINEEEGKLDRIEITDYKIRSSGLYERAVYQFTMPAPSGVMTRYYIESTKLDHLSHGRVFSFNDNEEEIMNIVKEDLMIRFRRAQTVCNNISATLKNMGMRVPYEEKES